MYATLIDLGDRSQPATFRGIFLHRFVDVVGVPKHPNAAQDISVGCSSSPGLHRKVGLNYEHVGGGAGLGEISSTKADTSCFLLLSRLW